MENNDEKIWNTATIQLDDIRMKQRIVEFSRYADLGIENIEKIEIKALGGRKIILSLGACIYDGTGDISYDTLYSKADAAMYRSKKQQGFCATVHGAADEVFIP